MGVALSISALLVTWVSFHCEYTRLLLHTLSWNVKCKGEFWNVSQSVLDPKCFLSLKSVVREPSSERRKRDYGMTKNLAKDLGNELDLSSRIRRCAQQSGRLCLLLWTRWRVTSERMVRGAHWPKTTLTCESKFWDKDHSHNIQAPVLPCNRLGMAYLNTFGDFGQNRLNISLIVSIGFNFNLDGQLKNQAMYGRKWQVYSKYTIGMGVRQRKMRQSPALI